MKSKHHSEQLITAGIFSILSFTIFFYIGIKMTYNRITSKSETESSSKTDVVLLSAQTLMDNVEIKNIHFYDINSLSNSVTIIVRENNNFNVYGKPVNITTSNNVTVIKDK